MSQQAPGAGAFPGGDLAALQIAAGQNDTNRHAEALRTLAPYLARHPDDVRALGLQAQALLGLGEPAQATVAARTVVGLEPDHEWALRLLSISYQRQGLLPQARAAAEAARAADPGNMYTYLQLCNVDLSADRVGAETLANAREAVRLSPGEPAAHTMLGLILVRLKNLDEGEASYREALRLDPQSADARHNFSLLELRRGNVGRAAAGFMNALAVTPDDKQVVLSLKLTTAAWLRRISITLWLLFLADIVLVASLEANDPAAAKLTSQLFAGIIVVALAFWVLWIRETAGVRFFRFVRTLPRIDRLLAVRTAILAASVLIMLVSAALPVGMDLSFFAVLALAVATLMALLWNARISRRSRIVLLWIVVVAIFLISTLVRLAGNHAAAPDLDFPSVTPLPTDLFDFPTDLPTDFPTIPPMPSFSVPSIVVPSGR